MRYPHPRRTVIDTTVGNRVQFRTVLRSRVSAIPAHVNEKQHADRGDPRGVVSPELANQPNGRGRALTSETSRTFLAAVAGTGLQSAADQVAVALSASGDDPVRRLHVLMEVYISVIRERPHVHDLAYGPLVTKSDRPRIQGAAIAYWNLLSGHRRGLSACGILEPELLRRCAAAWGTFYGIARLGAATRENGSSSVPC